MTISPNLASKPRHDPYAFIAQSIERFKRLSLEERLAIFRRAGIFNEKGELTRDYGGTGDPSKDQRKLPVEE